MAELRDGVLQDPNVEAVAWLPGFLLYTIAPDPAISGLFNLVAVSCTLPAGGSDCSM